MIDPANKRGTKTTKETKFFVAGDGGSTLCFQLKKKKKEKVKERDIIHLLPFHHS